MNIVLVAVTSAFFVSGAYAQTPNAPAGTPPVAGAAAPAMAGSASKRDAAVEKHIKDLHAQLKITPAEETQWSVVARAMRDSAVATDQAIDKREGIVGSATAIDNLNSYGDIAQAHADGVKKLAAAFAPLYASMPADQKKVADTVFSHHDAHDKMAAK
jgi:hypothetical protein